MGLDISAYSRLKFVSAVPDKTDDDFFDGLYDNHQLCLDEEHHDMARPGGLTFGVYGFDPKRQFGFRAGSYSGYNQWRATLCTLSGLAPNPIAVFEDETNKFVDKPFYELVNFTDCDGWIGPEVCAKLYDDFVDNEEAIMNSLEDAVEVGQLLEGEAKYFIDRYLDWKHAFEVASDGGCVEFH